jgi:hypothetical protein
MLEQFCVQQLLLRGRRTLTHQRLISTAQIVRIG